MPEPGLEPVYPLEEALLGGFINKGIGSIANRILGPKVNNIVTKVNSGKENVLSGRLPKSQSEITHASRNMSQAEIDAARNSNRFEANPNPIYGSDKTAKWWSPADSQGSFGRPWKNTEGNSTVRVPAKDANSSRAISTKNAEIQNRATGEWTPFNKGGKVKVKVKPTASSRGDGCAQRGKTRGTYK